MSISGLGRVACLLQGAAKGRGSLPPLPWVWSCSLAFDTKTSGELVLFLVSPSHQGCKELGVTLEPSGIERHHAMSPPPAQPHHCTCSQGLVPKPRSKMMAWLGADVPC